MRNSKLWCNFNCVSKSRRRKIRRHPFDESFTIRVEDASVQAAVGVDTLVGSRKKLI